MSTDQEKKRPERIRFFYLKSPSFSTIHADGVIGGPTPSRGIHIAFFAERVAIPTEIEFRVGPDGAIGDETERVMRNGIVRELQVDIMMDLRTADAVHRWLGTILEKFEQAKESAAQDEKGAGEAGGGSGDATA